MICKCGERMRCYKTISDSSRMVHRYHKCDVCGKTEKSVELPYDLLEEAGIADTTDLQKRINYLSTEKTYTKKKMRFTALEIVYGKKKK